MFGKRRKAALKRSQQVDLLSPVERLVSLAGGVMLIDRGLRRGGIDGIVAIIAGSFLTSRGLHGDSSIRQLLNDTGLIPHDRSH